MASEHITDTIEAFLDNQEIAPKYNKRTNKGTTKKFQTLQKLSYIESKLSLREKYFEEFTKNFQKLNEYQFKISDKLWHR